MAAPFFVFIHTNLHTLPDFIDTVCTGAGRGLRLPQGISNKPVKSLLQAEADALNATRYNYHTYRPVLIAVTCKFICNLPKTIKQSCGGCGKALREYSIACIFAVNLVIFALN